MNYPLNQGVTPPPSHTHTVISLDPLLQEFYVHISNKVGMVNVTFVSLAGGERDIMVPTLLSAIPHAINLAVSTLIISSHRHSHNIYH